MSANTLNFGATYRIHCESDTIPIIATTQPCELICDTSLISKKFRAITTAVSTYHRYSLILPIHDSLQKLFTTEIMSSFA